MRTERIPLTPPGPGSELSLTVHRFGDSDARPRFYVQAALHADEIPGMLVAQHLRQFLSTLEAQGRITGEVVLVPFANPIGLAQKILGRAIGRFSLIDGVNFNRGYPHVVPKIAERIASQLSDDAATNVKLIRAALLAEVQAWEATSAADQLKKTLLSLAIEADVVLDMHCDAEAVFHLYTHTRSTDYFAPLGALLGAEAILVADESGDDPFDEACSRPWAELAGRFPGAAIPMACHATTLEFRGETDVNDEAAQSDALRLTEFMILERVISGQVPVMPEPQCGPTPLAGSEPVKAPASGIIVFRVRPGERVKSGAVIADMINPVTGERTAVRSTTDGVMFARAAVRFAMSGQTIAKVAGAVARRSGKLLTA